MGKPGAVQEHPIVSLARRTIETYVREGRSPDPPDDLSENLPARAGAFVSLHTHDRLRGCIGTIEPVQDSLAQEVISNAISAATRDPRFPPLTVTELPDLDISVDVLGVAEAITDMDELDPVKYGVIVELGRRRGLLLPDLEGVDTAEQQVNIALQKAWINSGERYQLYRFRVTRYH